MHSISKGISSCFEMTHSCFELINSNPQLLRTDLQHQQLFERTTASAAATILTLPVRPVNLTMSDRTVRPSAMTMPSFTPTNQVRDREGGELGDKPQPCHLRHTAHQPCSSTRRKCSQTGSSVQLLHAGHPNYPQQDQDKWFQVLPDLHPSPQTRRRVTPVKIPPAPAGLSRRMLLPTAAAWDSSPRPTPPAASSTVSVPSSLHFGDEQNAPCTSCPAPPGTHQERNQESNSCRRLPSAVNVSPEWHGGQTGGQRKRQVGVGRGVS